MQFSRYITFVSILAEICSAVPHFVRATHTQDDIILYAYGTNISGLPLAFGNSDSLAYIISSPMANFSSLTMDITNSGDVAWNGTINNSTSVGSFYIVNDNTSYVQAGFVPSNGSTAVEGAATVGFSMFGGQVVFIDSDGNYLSQFWAQETHTDGVWSLVWNSAGSSQSNSVPVTVKTISIA